MVIFFKGSTLISLFFKRYILKYRMYICKDRMSDIYFKIICRGQGDEEAKAKLAVS